MKTSVVVSTLFVATSCATPDGNEPGDGGGGAEGAVGTTSLATTATTSGSTSATSTGSLAMASWDVSGNFTINGFALQEGIRSATAVVRAIDGADYLSVVLTDVADYCTAARNEACGQDPHFGVAIDLGTVRAPGTYAIGGGQVGATIGDLATWCAVGGLGADGGTVTLQSIDTQAVTLTFDITSLSMHAEGKVTALLCDIPSP